MEASSASSPLLTTCSSSSSSSSKRKSLLSGSLRVVNANSGDNDPQGPSVLNAIERLIEKSFEYKRGKSVYTSSSTTPLSLKKTSLEDVAAVGTHKVKSDVSDVSGAEDGDDVLDDKTPKPVADKEPVLPASEQLVDGNGDDYHEDTDVGEAEEEPEDKELEADEATAKKRRKRTPKTASSEDRTSVSPASACADAADVPLSVTPPSAAGNSQHCHSPLVTSRPASSGSAVVSADEERGSIVRSPAVDLCTTTTNSGGRSGGLSLVCTTTPPSPSSSDHPLRELQKLLDKTNVSLSSSSSSAKTSTTSTVSIAGGATATVVSGSGSGVGDGGGGSGQDSSAGALLAFRWACSDLLMAESVIKCPFCDTPFISKGAYRHHLSKMHFVKDGTVDGTTTKCPSTAVTTSTTSVVNVSGGGGGGSSSNSSSNSSKPSASPPVLVASSSASSKSPPKTPVDESPHSKFLKYTELAKQLSSKYV